MMPLERQVTSLALSQRLAKLGVKQEAYLYWWESGYSGAFQLGTEKDAERWESSAFSDETFGYTKVAAAFTVAELGEMLPDYTASHLVSAEEPYWICYDQIGDGTVRFPEGPCPSAPTEAESRGLMLEYLTTNGLMNV